MAPEKFSVPWRKSHLPALPKARKIAQRSGGYSAEVSSINQKHFERSVHMSKSQFVDFRAVKRGVSMVQVLEHYGLMSQLHRSGQRLTAPTLTIC